MSRFQLEKEEQKKLDREAKALKSGLDLRWNSAPVNEIAGIERVTLIDRGHEVFMVVVGIHEDGHRMVAFDSADGMYAAVLKLARKSVSGGYKWKVDTPAPSALDDQRSVD